MKFWVTLLVFPLMLTSGYRALAQSHSPEAAKFYNGIASEVNDVRKEINSISDLISEKKFSKIKKAYHELNEKIWEGKKNIAGLEPVGSEGFILKKVALALLQSYGEIAAEDYQQIVKILSKDEEFVSNQDIEQVNLIILAINKKLVSLSEQYQTIEAEFLSTSGLSG